MINLNRFSLRWLVLTAGFGLALTACGTPAVTAPTLPATLELPTRIAVLPTDVPGTTPQANAPAAVAVQPSSTPTTAPVQATATITLIPVTPTPTTVPKVIATATKAATAIPGDPGKGEVLFAKGTGNTSIPACSVCHAVDASQDVGKVGPLLKGVASRAGKRVAGQDAYTYLHNSIVNPNAFIVPNEGSKVYSGDGKVSLMYQNYAKDLSEDQINDLVAYLLTLK